MAIKTVWHKSSAILILTIVVVIALIAIGSSVQTTTAFTGILLDILLLIVSISASWFFAQSSAKQAAKDTFAPIARSAFRRLRSTQRGLYQASERISKERAASADLRTRTGEQTDNETLNVIGAIITQQLYAIGDAMEDWADIVPDELEGLRAQHNEQSVSSGGQTTEVAQRD